MKKIIPLASSLACMVLFSNCTKPYVDIDCSDVTLCVKNISSDTIFINWYSTGYENDWPVMILPGKEVCKGFGQFQEYGKNGAFKSEYSKSGTNSVNYSTSNGEYSVHPFSSCEDHVEISH